MAIRFPAHKNNKDLKSAWVNRWKNAKFSWFIPKVAIIRPS